MARRKFDLVPSLELVQVVDLNSSHLVLKPLEGCSHHARHAPVFVAAQRFGNVAKAEIGDIVFFGAVF